MSNLSKEFAEKIFAVIDGKIELNEFETWVYNNDYLEKELSQDDYFQLISFNFLQKDAHEKLNEILYRILGNYLTQKQQLRVKSSIQGLCVSNKGRYRFDKTGRLFSVTIGKSYDILSLQFDKEKDGKLYSMYVIIDDDYSIYYIPSETLRIGRISIPDGWVVEENEVMLVIEPKEWNDNYYKGEFSFWEDFHDDKENAIFEFIKVLQKQNIEVPPQYRLYAYKLLTSQK